MSATTADRAVPQRRSRLAAWWNSWAVALRIGRRDAWRHRGRSLLVLAMIGLPVLVLVAALTAFATIEVSDAEKVAGRMGSAQAVVIVGEGSGPPGTAPCQTPAGEYSISCASDTRPLVPLPGTTASTPLAKQAAAVRAAFHADDVVPYARSAVQAEVPAGRMGLQVLRTDPTADALRGMVDLTSGRWPTAPDEVVVTDTGVRSGAPDHGTVRLTAEEGSIVPGTAATAQDLRTLPTRPYRVVGTARTAYEARVDVVRADPAPADADGLLVTRATPITWDEVKQANRHGLVVGSRAVIEDPPSSGEVEAYAGGSSGSQGVPAAGMALLMTALFVACALLAGPAFTVIAARQRRTLAMAASNGATGAQLRRTMLGQAVVLGAGGSAVAAALGVAVTWPGLRVAQEWHPVVQGRRLALLGQVGPFDVPWAQLLLVVGAATSAALVAALLPARGLADLDVIAALRGDVAPKRPRRRAPVVGAVLAVAGGAALWTAFELVGRHGDADGWITTLLVAGCLALVGGALMAVPMLLVGVARALRGAPLTWRMAARDAARRRGPATSTVAAVMAGTTLLAGSLVMLASFDAMSRAEYRTTVPMGVSRAELTHPDALAATTAALRAEVPGARTAVAGSPLDRPLAELDSASPGTPRRAWAIGPAGCRPGPASPTSPYGYDTCTHATFGDGSYGAYGEVLVVDPAALTTVIPLPPVARTTLDAGGLVTTAPSLPTGRAEVRRMALRDDPTGQAPQVATPDGAATVLPVLQVRTGELGTWNGAPYASPDQGVTLMTAATARRLGTPVVEPRLLLARGPQPLTLDQERRVTERVVRTPGPWAAAGHLPDDVDAMEYSGAMTTERGYQSPVRDITLGLAAAVVLLILVATVTATALAVGEARRDLVTLGTLGASPRTPRALAAATAALLAVVGTLVGYAVGAVPGVIWAHYATGRPVDPTVEGSPRTWDLAVPWGTLGATLVGATLVAAAAAWLLVRPSVDLTRRAR